MLGSSWDEHLLETMAGLIAENNEDVRTNANRLTATQLALVLGIVAAPVAVLKQREIRGGMSEESREKARKHGIKSGKGTQLVSRAVAWLKDSEKD